MRETPVSLSLPMRDGGIAAGRPRHRWRRATGVLAAATLIASGALIAARWFDDTQARDGVQILHPLPQASPDDKLAATTSAMAYPFGKDSRAPDSKGRDAPSTTNVPPGVAPKQWQALVAKAATRSDGAQEIARLDASYRFADAVRQFRDLAQASHDRPGAALVALARHLDVQLDSQFAQRGMTLSDAAALKAALLAVLAPHADAADAALERWVQAQTRVRSDDLRDALQRNPAFARRHAEVIKAWQAQPPLRRDPKDLERDLERLHLEMLGSR